MSLKTKKRLLKDARRLDRIRRLAAKIGERAYKEYDYQCCIQIFGGTDTQIRDNARVIYDACAEIAAVIAIAEKKLR